MHLETFVRYRACFLKDHTLMDSRGFDFMSWLWQQGIEGVFSNQEDVSFGG